MKHPLPLSTVLFAFLLGVSNIHADAPVPPTEKLSDFMRVTQKEGRRRPHTFETAVVKFVDSRKGVEVDLIAAVHIGDKAYYEELNELFQRYDAMLYELVAKEGTVPDPKANQRKDGNKSLLSGIQSGIGDTLALEHQLAHVDYTPKNFVHADLSPEEFARRVAERGDLIQMLYRVIVLGAKKEKEGRDDEMRLQGRLLGAMLVRNPALALKRFFAREMIDQMDDSAWVIGGDEGSAIITDRNAAALKVLRREIQSGKKKIGIFYGAAHLPEFARSLEKEFKMKPVEVSWIVAWDLTSDQTARKP